MMLIFGLYAVGKESYRTVSRVYIQIIPFIHATLSNAKTRYIRATRCKLDAGSLLDISRRWSKFTVPAHTQPASASSDPMCAPRFLSYIYVWASTASRDSKRSDVHIAPDMRIKFALTYGTCTPPRVAQN